MTRLRDLTVRHAWRGALAAAFLNAVASPADFLLARDIPNMPLYPSVSSALVGAALIAVLLIRQDRATVRLGSVVFLVNTVAILWALWITSGYWASSGRPWTPFQANKLGALAVALLAPELTVGLAAIAGFTLIPIAKFYTLAPAVQRGLPAGEPWTILMYAFFAGVLLVYRRRGVKTERELFRVQAESAAAERLAKTFLRVRDYANTPIQTIVWTAALIQVRDPDLKPVLLRLERAVEKLVELSQVLTRYETSHTWRPGDESLDAAILAEELPDGDLHQP